MYYMGLDIETDDPCLKDRGKQKAKGPSWIFGEGRVICTGLYNGKETKAFKGNGGDFVRKLLLRDDVTIVGANIQYDMGWLLSSFGMDSYDVRCSFIDVAIVESLIDEYQDFSLDALAVKYLKEHKKKSVLEDICLAENLKGDFRQHLGKLWDEGYSREIMDYVASDADQPLRIWNLQKEIIERDNLWEGFQMNMDMIPVVISMQQKGVRIDVPKWEENCKKAQEAYERLKGDFEAKYGKVNINSPKQLSELLDKFDVPYKKRITVKGYQPADRKFTQADCFKGDELSEQKKRLKEVYSGITIEKGKLVLYLPKIYADRACAEILDRGYCAICNPVVGKPMFAECAASYDIVRDLVQYKQVKNIVDKFLGPVFGRFLAPDGRLHGTFNIVGARRTGRLSCTKMNLQQIPSKTKLFEKTDHEVDLAHMCRECFIPDEGQAFVKLDYCLSMDSMFLTDRGYVRGDEMYKGAGLLDLDGNLQDYECYVQERDMISFELDNGVVLKQIPEHRHFGTDKASKYIKLAKNFKVGDQLAFEGRDFPQSGVCDVRSILHTDYTDNTLGYVCGLYLGDGYVKETGDGEIVLHASNQFLMNMLDRIFTGGKHTIGQIHHAYLRKSFGKVIAQEFGRKENKTVPDWVLTASANFRAGLIAGLLDTDAYITGKKCTIVMCREHLMRKIAEFLACCGIYAKWGEQYVSADKNNFGKEHTNYSLYIRIIPSDLRALIEGNMLHRDLSIWKGSNIKLSWNFDWSELPEKMFRQHDGALQKSLYNARHFGRGIPLETMNRLGLWQSDKIPVTIKKIVGGFREKALIMQCDTHMFRTYNMPTMNCGQENRVVAHFASGKNGEFVQNEYIKNPYFDEHDYVAKVSGLEEAHGKKVGRKYAKNLRFGVCLSSDSVYATRCGALKGWTLPRINAPLCDLKGEVQSYKSTLFRDKGLEFELSNGVKFTSTYEHLFLDCESVTWKTKKASDMKLGDRLPIAKPMEVIRPYMPMGEGFVFDEGLAYLAGLYVGDGSIAGSVSLITHKVNTQEVLDILKEHSVGYSTYTEHSVIDRICVHKELRDFFRGFGVGADAKTVPDFVFMSATKVQLSFLAGLLDSDGCITKYSQRLMGCNEGLMRKVALLCVTLGMSCKWSVCHHKEVGKKDEYVLDIHYSPYKIPARYRTGFWQENSDYLGWNIPAEQLEQFRTPGMYKTNVQLYDYLRGKRGLYSHNSWLPDNVWQKQYLPVEIVKITPVKNREFVFLETQTGYYIANGFATHNCYGMQRPGMMKNFGWTKEFCDDLYEKVAGAAPWLFEVMEQVQEVVLHRRYIRTLAGRHIHLRKGRDKDAYKYMNYLIQGSASDMTKKATVAINRSRKGETMILTVHDEDCFSVPMTEEGVERIVELQHCMEHSSDLRVPAVCNPEIGPNWADGIEWGPEYGDVRTFISEVFRALKNGTFYKLKERLGNYNGDESFAEFCESLEEEEEDNE